ncbi:MAG: hypothetical protein LBS72_09190 [Oscillospiraceae bacterium]|jgi:hypothetical protein|nr:hypothetical protein [Oscillospiraceae bacterium]
MNSYSDWLRKLTSIKGYKWIVAIVVLGIAGSLMLTDGNIFVGQTPTLTGTDLETRLEQILSSIEGAGEVRVMVYESNEQTTDGWLSSTSTKVGEPTGVVIVADGASDIRVRLELVRAVQTLMGLPASAVNVFQHKAE